MTVERERVCVRVCVRVRERGSDNGGGVADVAQVP